MSIAERRVRDREARRRLITSTARILAEQEGWDAVTTRRLSTEIEYSQPVLYKHFASMEDIVDAVALEGFAELAEVLCAARRDGGPPEEALGRVAHAFSSFATDNPALYDAMFTRTSRLRFGANDTPAPLTAAFTETTRGRRRRRQRARRRHPHRGAVGRTARIDHARPRRPATPRPRHRPHRAPGQPVPRIRFLKAPGKGSGLRSASHATRSRGHPSAVVHFETRMREERPQGTHDSTDKPCQSYRPVGGPRIAGTIREWHQYPPGAASASLER